MGLGCLPKSLYGVNFPVLQPPLPPDRQRGASRACRAAKERVLHAATDELSSASASNALAPPHSLPALRGCHSVAVNGNRSRPLTTGHQAKTHILHGLLSVSDRARPLTGGFDSRRPLHKRPVNTGLFFVAPQHGPFENEFWGARGPRPAARPSRPLPPANVK